MGEELEKRQLPEQASGPTYFEGSWVGQFRAIDEEKARLFANTVAQAMETLGVSDVGYDVRSGSYREFAADEGARASLADMVPSIDHESVSHEDVRRQLKEARERSERQD